MLSMNGPQFNALRFIGLHLRNLHLQREEERQQKIAEQEALEQEMRDFVEETNMASNFEGVVNLVLDAEANMPINQAAPTGAQLQPKRKASVAKKGAAAGSFRLKKMSSKLSNNAAGLKSASK